MKTDRLIAIVMILLERDMVSANELAEMFEVSPRTIYRDIESIGKSGIPIVSSPGPGGGVGIMPSYKVEKRLFSAGDITALLMGLTHIQSNLPGDQMATTLAKMRGMVPEEEYRKLELRANQIKIDLSPWHGNNALPQTLETIRLALEQRRVVRFSYVDRHSDASIREVEPHRLLLKDMNWYLQGHCRMRGEQRTFKLLRIRAIRLLEETFVLNELPLEELDQLEFRDEPRETVTLRFRADIWDQVTAYVGEDNVTPDGPHHYLAHFDMPITETSALILLAFGPHCTCLGPPPLRQMMEGLLTRMLSSYRAESPHHKK